MWKRTFGKFALRALLSKKPCKLYINEKLMKYKRKVLEVFFFPANLASIFFLKKEEIKRKFENLTRSC